MKGNEGMNANGVLEFRAERLEILKILRNTKNLEEAGKAIK